MRCKFAKPFNSSEGYLRICFAQSADRIERAMNRLREGLRVAPA
jgi:hypothetical protein